MQQTWLLQLERSGCFPNSRVFTGEGFNARIQRQGRINVLGPFLHLLKVLQSSHLPLLPWSLVPTCSFSWRQCLQLMQHILRCEVIHLFSDLLILFFFFNNFNWRLITTLWWVLPHIDMNHPWVYGCPPAPVPNTPSLFLLFLKHSSHSLCLLAYLLSRVQLCETPWTAARQASLSFTIAQTLLKLMSIKSVKPSTHLILCYPLSLLRVCSNSYPSSQWCHPPISSSVIPCPSLLLTVCSNSCPSSRWCHPPISSSVVPFSSCPQSFPASGSFPVSLLFTSGG